MMEHSTSKLRSALQSQSSQLVGLSVLTVGLAVIMLVRPTWMPIASFSVVLTLGGFYLRVRTLLVLYLLVASVMIFVSANRVFSPTPGNIFVVAATGVLAMAYALSRRDIGLQGRESDSMLLDLRDRLLAQGRIPPLPRDWGVEAEFSAADWQRFSGDFMVATCPDEDHLEMVLVDVSGKGPAAGTRALSLSGALSGILGATAPWEFMPAANRYLTKQGWGEGFATAVHVHVNFSSGYYSITYAGHPPAAHYKVHERKWSLVTNQGGVALGILEDMTFNASRGVLAPGDALMFYTDGLVEVPGQDVGHGIERLLQFASHQTDGPYAGAAARIMTKLGAGEDDDRSLIVLWRAPA